MNEDVRHLQNLVFALCVVGMGCFAAILGVVTTWIRYRAKRVVSSDITARLGEMANRMARLDNAVDAIAVEVERISEGQRFVTKVLADRTAASALSDGARAVGSRQDEHQS